MIDGRMGADVRTHNRGNTKVPHISVLSGTTLHWCIGSDIHVISGQRHLKLGMFDLPFPYYPTHRRNGGACHTS